MKPTTQTFFTDLAGQMITTGDAEAAYQPRKIDGMSAGTFTDMWGQEWIYKTEDLPAYVANTNRALESTRDSAGQIVGFPIDASNHNHGSAAGWIVGVSLAADRAVIELDVRWNWAGASAVGSDEMRYFSPSIDVVHQVIVGGSLTNWPATRTDDHQILLRPVELSQQLFTLDAPAFEAGPSFWDRMTDLITGLFKPVQTPKGDSMPDVTVPAPEAPPAVVDLASPEITQLIEARAEERATAILAQREHAAHVAHLATRLIGGSADTPHGLPVDQTELQTFLASLSTAQYAQAESLLTRIAATGLVDFSEHGHSRTVQGGAELPEPIKPLLRKWIEKGHSIPDFFQANAVELGAQSDYNLTEFQTKGA
jgi:hypothetical protein